MVSGRREGILEAAAEVLAERGFKGTSIDAVAERAGLTRQGVLHYFPSKKRLLLELLEFRVRLVREHLAGRPVGEDCPGDFAEVIAFEREHPSFATVHSVVIAEAVTGQEPAAAFVRDRYRTFQEHLTAELVRLFGERLPSGLSADTAALACLALFEGAQQMGLVDGEADRWPQIVRESLAVLLGTENGDADGTGVEDDAAEGIGSVGVGSTTASGIGRPPRTMCVADTRVFADAPHGVGSPG